MGGDETASCALVEVMEPRLDRSDVGKDALLRQVGDDFIEGRDGVFYRHRIDAQFGLEGAYLLKVSETLTVVCETQTLRVFFIYSHLVVETEEVGEERPHLACS